MSVNETTPDSRPLMPAPGNCPAPMLTPGLADVYGGTGVMLSFMPPDRAGVVTGVLCDISAPCCALVWFCMLKGGTECFKPGDGGTLALGDGASTIHMRWERVAHSLATAWARVEKGVTWNTGYESLPSNMPRSERMTPMKWRQVEWSKGMAEVSVSSYYKVSR